MKKIVKRFLLALVLIPVTLLGVGTAAYLLYGLLALGGESLTHQAYLRKHLIPVQPGAANPSLQFERAFYRNQLFLLGEAHGFAAPQELDFQLLKHLNEKAGVTHYLAEVDYSQAHFLNEYLRTGDERLLRYVFDTWVRANAQWGQPKLLRQDQTDAGPEPVPAPRPADYVPRGRPHPGRCRDGPLPAAPAVGGRLG
jgi:hypothetical protein